MNYAPLVAKLLSCAARERPFSPNFLSLISKNGQVAEVTRFSRETFFEQLRFLSLSLSQSSFSPVDGRRNDLPRRQTMLESFSYSRRIRPGRQIFLTCSSRFSGLSPRIPLHGSIRQLNLIKTSFVRALRIERIRKKEKEERGREGDNPLEKSPGRHRKFTGTLPHSPLFPPALQSSSQSNQSVRLYKSAGI